MHQKSDVFDVIIIGGGSAGCAAAARLSEDSSRRVLLLEAGPDPLPIPESISDGINQTRAMLESPYVVMYPTQRKGDDSTFYKLSGRIMGGGSSVNALAVVRPTKHDLDSWAARGNPGWSYDDCLPILKRIEADQDYGDSDLHGTNGPLFVKRPFRLDMEASRPVQAFIDRAVAMGMPMCPDLNVPEPYGVCGSAYNVKDGLRQSTSVAYLDPARSRPNLRIISEATVHEVLSQGRRATGVRYEVGGSHSEAYADSVVLSAGVYHSPQILTLSGIGSEQDLNRLGIDRVHVLSGVGQNYQDHATVEMTYEGLSDFDPDWVIPRFRLMFKSDPSLPSGNFHIFMRAPIEVPGLKRMMPVSANLLEQRALGRVVILSRDPHDLPEIDDALLVDEDDLRAMVIAMEFIHELISDSTMRPFYGPLLQPGPSDDWGEYARNTHGSYQHGVGTCMMGPSDDPMAVVDHQLRVHGFDNLYVADASVMPTITHANTNVSSIMMGERVSDFIKEHGG